MTQNAVREGASEIPELERSHISSITVNIENRVTNLPLNHVTLDTSREFDEQAYEI